MDTDIPYSYRSKMISTMECGPSASRRYSSSSRMLKPKRLIRVSNIVGRDCVIFDKEDMSVGLVISALPTINQITGHSCAKRRAVYGGHMTGSYALNTDYRTPAPVWAGFSKTRSVGIQAISEINAPDLGLARPR